MDKAPPKEEVVEIDCADLIVRPDNRALDETMVAEIAESFERSSQATPMLVRRLMDNKYEIIDGQHRFAAKRLAAIRYTCWSPTSRSQSLWLTKGVFTNGSGSE